MAVCELHIRTKTVVDSWRPVRTVNDQLYYSKEAATNQSEVFIETLATLSPLPNHSPTKIIVSVYPASGPFVQVYVLRV